MVDKLCIFPSVCSLTLYGSVFPTGGIVANGAQLPIATIDKDNGTKIVGLLIIGTREDGQTAIIEGSGEAFRAETSRANEVGVLVGVKKGETLGLVKGGRRRRTAG